ncbi:hypothetical protein HMSLTHF_05310 [Vreelandella aquamarina]|uniref:Uncharacterized protein n=1 Tax=Vreelandella aquamarina TaxID=77097 RepID=A0A6F8SST7_9GAMM|nr:hypothetical protein HMSLTHF_05310 [Halomonas meridiana]
MSTCVQGSPLVYKETIYALASPISGYGALRLNRRLYDLPHRSLAAIAAL